jgi:hypothetical protein
LQKLFFGCKVKIDNIEYNNLLNIMGKPTQTDSGQFKRKREDTLIGNIEKKYDVNFRVRDDMKLGTYLKEKGLPSLSKALDKVNKQK